MKKVIIIFISIIIVNFSSATATRAQSTRTRIMPLGDSITDGYIEGLSDEFMVGYRQKLYLDLVNAGYDVDFVGSLNSGNLATPSFDYNHEGHGGWNDNEVAGQVYKWLIDNPADIVLLHIGTNDLTSSPDDVELILDEIDRYSKDTLVILALIINNKKYNHTVTEFNNNVRAMAERRIAHCDKIILVDMENALNYQDDMSDNLHPNPNGYAKMSNVWFTALKPILDNHYQPPPCTPIVPGPDLQAYYTFNQNTGTSVIDSSSYKRTGTIFGATWTTGKMNNGLSFNGIDAYVSIPRINNDEMSITAWFYKNGNDTSHADAIFGAWKWYSDLQFQEGFDLRFHQYTPNTLEFILLTRDKDGVKTSRKATYNLNNSAGRWHHVAGTYNKTTGKQKLYIDGELVSTQEHPPGNTIMPLAYYSDMRIGYSRTNTGYFNGVIDDVRLYNREISDHEVQDIYQGNEPIVTIAVATAGNGSVSVNPDPPYRSGQTITLDAIPDFGWIFNRWSGDLSGTNGHKTLIITDDTKATATFSSASSVGLQAFYSFEEGSGNTLTDLSGNGNAGVIKGAAWTKGKVGGGLGFDDANDLVSIPSINCDGISVSAWFFKNTNDSTHTRAIISGRRWSTVPQNRQGFELRFSLNAPDTLQFIVVTEDQQGNKTSRIAQKNITNSLNNWYHVVGIYKQSTGIQKLFINGQLVKTQKHPAGNTIVPLTYYPDIWIGNSRADKGYFHGVIDDIRIYRRALSNQKVRELYQSY